MKVGTIVRYSDRYCNLFEPKCPEWLKNRRGKVTRVEMDRIRVHWDFDKIISYRTWNIPHQLEITEYPRNYAVPEFGKSINDRPYPVKGA